LSKSTTAKRHAGARSAKAGKIKARLKQNRATSADAASSIGWFNYAVAYLRAAQTLYKHETGVAHSSAPVEFLYYHAIELLLKTYLLHSGLNEKQLKALGHGLIALGEECETRGLYLTGAHRETIDFIEHQGNLFKSRYIRLGRFQRASFADLNKLAGHIANTLRDILFKSADASTD
jgi:hypothetical protein